MSNTTPNGNSEIPLELKKILNSLSRNQQSFYNTSANKINFLKAIREERKKWKLAINVSFTVLTILVTIAINAVAKIFNNDEYINKFVLILNCIVFGIQAFTIISVPVNEGIFDDKTWTRVVWILIPTIIGILLAIFLGIYVLPASVTISWIVVGVLGSNLFLQAFEYFLE
ncbi:hypothetical protein C2G38_2215576 [Gigaspora rosea]|uniref:Transmembrane protein n=1 Tax=Gigaspora rosea TaxID=44941 RepID=A0A397UCZ4_9GLOM|nr:hypothetical protein C2G38_2215576 [Gigaspora rosea]